MHLRRLAQGAKTLAIVLVLATQAACQQGGTAGESPSPSRAPTATALSACPSLAAPAGPQPLLKGLPAPDDVALDDHGRVLFSDINAGTVSAINADGSVERLAVGLNEPEGMVALPDDRILVAEQGHNRVDALDLQTHAISVWRAFPNRTSNPGIDGIGPIVPAQDSDGKPLPNQGDILVPDSPNGVVWAVTPDGKSATRIASGMVRPVGAAIDGNGRIFIADEGGAVWVLSPLKRRFTTLATPDDVAIGPKGEIFVNTLGDNAIHELNEQGLTVAVTRGIAQPQGIALDSAGNLYYTEFTGGRIDRIVRTFILEAPRVKKVSAGHFTVCPMIARAAGFSDQLTFRTVPPNQTWIDTMLPPGSDSSGALLVESTAPSVTLGVFDTSAPIGLTQTIALPP